MTTMNELLKALKRLKVETGSLVCFGCGHEHNCWVHGCAIRTLKEMKETKKPLNLSGKNYFNLSWLYG